MDWLSLFFCIYLSGVIYNLVVHVLAVSISAMIAATSYNKKVRVLKIIFLTLFQLSYNWPAVKMVSLSWISTPAINSAAIGVLIYQLSAAMNKLKSENHKE